MTDIDELFTGVTEADKGTDWLAMLEKVDKMLAKPVIREFIQNIFNRKVKNVNDYEPEENVSLPIQKQATKTKAKKGGGIHELTAENLFDYMTTILGLVIGQEGDKVTVKEMLDDLNSKKQETIKLIDKMI